MINAAEMFVGLRYLRAKRQTRFVSFITFISLGGIALGVAALIVILSVMNGYVEKMVVSNRSSAVYKALEAGTSTEMIKNHMPSLNINGILKSE